MYNLYIMIQLCVDESYAFEYYCILLVKLKKINSKEISQQEKIQRDFLISQLGDKKFNDICSSKQFKYMLTVNEQTFDAVDKAKTNSIKASKVDACSFNRKKAKDALQKEFFDSENLEIKIGYGLC